MLRAYRDYRGLCTDMHFWARGGSTETEVDFLLSRGTEFVAVEVKSGRTWTESWCKGLRAIAALPGVRRRLIVYPEGPVQRTQDGIDVMPFKYFSDLLHGDALWP